MFQELMVVVFFISNSNSIFEPPRFANVEQADLCADSDPKCGAWAESGECNRNPAWMMANCKKSCQSCQADEGAWKLRDNLVSKYDNESRILQKYIDGNISVHSFFIDRIRINEQDQIAKVNGKMVLTWIDKRVTWTPDEWHLVWLNFFWPQIWSPKITQTNAPIGSIGSTYNTLLGANFTGQIYMWCDFVFSTSTNFHYGKFPYDSHDVCINIENKEYYAVKLTVSGDARGEALESAKKSEPAGWKVTDVSIEQIKGSVKLLTDWHTDPFNIEKSSVDICIKVERDSSHANLEILTPALVPAIVTLISFLFDDFRRQIFVLGVSLGLQVIAVNPIQHALPPAAGVTPSALKFCGFNTGMTCFILFITLLLLAMSTKKSLLPPPVWAQNLAKIIHAFNPCSCTSSSSASPDHDEVAVVTNGTSGKQNAPEHQHGFLWQPLALALKILLCWSCLFVYTVVFLAFFIF